MLKNYKKFCESKNNKYELSFWVDCYACEDDDDYCSDCYGEKSYDYDFVFDGKLKELICMDGTIESINKKDDIDNISIEDEIIDILKLAFDNPGLNKKEMINLLVYHIISNEYEIYFSEEYEKYFDQETKNLVKSSGGIKKFGL